MNKFVFLLFGLCAIVVVPQVQAGDKVHIQIKIPVLTDVADRLLTAVAKAVRKIIKEVNALSPALAGDLDKFLDRSIKFTEKLISKDTIHKAVETVKDILENPVDAVGKLFDLAIKIGSDLFDDVLDAAKDLLRDLKDKPCKK